MSLSGQYLEELSRRYKKQVEEMQRSLERAVAAMGEESRKGEEREAKRVEEITALREEIAILSKSVETLLYDRDSWRSRISGIAQHALLICFEIVVIVLILTYCRKGEDCEEKDKMLDTKEGNMRRRSAENFNSHTAAKKTKKRRPSEIASHISGTYHELMIDDRSHETKKERKKKRKKEATAAGTRTAEEAIRYKSGLNMISGITTLSSRRTSSIDASHTKESKNSIKRPESTSETAVSCFDDQTEKREWIIQSMPENKVSGMKFALNSELSRQVDELYESNSSSTTMDTSVEGSITAKRKVEIPRNGSFKASGILKSTRLTSPSFMKTALGTRNKRKSSSNSNEKLEWNQDSEHSNGRSLASSPTSIDTIDGSTNGNANGLIEESDESRSSSATPMLTKKEKRNTGLKKMMRKFF